MAEEELQRMEDTILGLLREQGSDESTETVEPEQQATESESTSAAIERARDEKGKFTKAQKTDSAATDTATTTLQETAPEANSVEAAEPPITTTSGQPIDLNRAPASWKPAAKAQWAGLPEPIRAEIYRRESDYMHGSKLLRDNADFGQTIRSTVEPYRMLIESEGGTPEKAISELLRTAALLRTGTQQQKLQALLATDRQFNIGLTQAIEQDVIARMNGQQPQTPTQQATFQDPRVDQILTNLQQQERARAQQDEATRNAATERFMTALGDDGHPRYPFVDNVLQDMLPRVSQLRQTNPSLTHEQILERAYDEAVWANPETRAVLISQQQAKQQASEETLRQAEAAKRASRFNLPKRGSLPAGKTTGTMDDTIRDTWRQLNG